MKGSDAIRRGRIPFGTGPVFFPLCFFGVYGYPKDQALQAAKDTINEFLKENDITVYIVIFDRKG